MDGEFRERVGPLDVQPHRRPTPKTEEPAAEPAAATVDWLGHLVAERGEVFDVGDDLGRYVRERQLADDAVVDIVRDRLDPAVFDEEAVRDFLQRYGPLDPEAVAEIVDFAVEHGGTDQHVQVVLEAVHDTLFGGAA